MNAVYTVPVIGTLGNFHGHVIVHEKFRTKCNPKASPNLNPNPKLNHNHNPNPNNNPKTNHKSNTNPNPNFKNIVEKQNLEKSST